MTCIEAYGHRALRSLTVFTVGALLLISLESLWLLGSPRPGGSAYSTLAIIGRLSVCVPFTGAVLSCCVGRLGNALGLLLGAALQMTFIEVLLYRFP